MHLNIPSFARFFASSTSLFLGSVAAEQESDEPIIELAPFTVTSDGAQSVLHITQRDLAQRQANDLEDALSIDPAVNVGGSTGVAQKIYVRNLGEGLLNVTIDGATQSGALFHHIGRIAIEPELIKQVEVQPGVGNASDGPGALGGAIRFASKDPADMLRDGEKAGGLVKIGYYDNTGGYKASANVFGRLGGNWSALASFVSSEYEEIQDGDGNELQGSDTQQQVAMAKLVGSLQNGHTLRFSVERLEESGSKLRRPEWAPGPENPTFPMSSDRLTSIIGYELASQERDWLNLRATMSYSDATILQNAVWGPYEGSIESLQFDLRNTQTLAGHQLVYGIDRREDKVAAGESVNPTAFREKSEVTGLFVQDAYQATEALRFDFGARLDFYRLRDQLEQRFRNEGFSPNAAATYAINPDWSLTASAATAFRGPDINDAFRIDRSRNDPTLSAEKARNYELRFAYDKNDLSLQFGAYQNRIDDVITNTLPWSTLYVNAGELETDGFFARAAYSGDSYSISLQYNNADTTLNGRTATRYQYSSLVSTIGDTWVFDAYWRPFAQFDLGWNARLVEGIDGIEIPEEITGVPNSSIDKPSYATHDFYLRWTPEFIEGVTLNLTVKNAFDKLYRSHGSIEDLTAFPGFEGVIGAAEPGRDIRLAATYRF